MTDHHTPLELRRFVRRTNEGMQRPPVFEASDDNEYVLKLDTADPSFPVAEVVAAVLAGALDVPIPDFALLDVPNVLTEALRTTGDADQLEFAEAFDRLEARCFGSRYLEGTPTKWTSRLHRGIAGGNEVLARVIVFDAFIENMDRSSSTNPNLLVTRGQLYAIDHGQALPSVQGVSLAWPFPFDSHLAWPTIERHPALLEAPTETLRALPDSAIDAAVGAVPTAWWRALDRPDLVRQTLTERRDRLVDTLVGLRERLG